jgi:hypothetical protein
VKLNLENTRRFNTLFIENWAKWIDRTKYAKEPFFTERVPVAVAVRYGQNISLGVAENLQRERQDWERFRQWEKVWFFSFAVASHVMWVPCCNSSLGVFD